jgi:hypothetical protein
MRESCPREEKRMYTETIHEHLPEDINRHPKVEQMGAVMKNLCIISAFTKFGTRELFETAVVMMHSCNTKFLALVSEESRSIWKR